VTAAHDRALRRPSRFRIPQLTSPDRRRARAATVAQRRDLYALTPWHPPSEAMWAGTGEWLRFPLPLKLANLPPDEAFSWRKWSQFLRNQSITKVNRALTTLLNPRAPMESYREYARLFEVFRPPTFAAARWRSDLDFAEQRLNGCNPMTLKRCQDLPDDALCRAADDTLSTLAPSWNVQRAHSQGRLFACDYSAVRLLEPVIPIGVAWSAPTALFFAGEDGRLRPLAIRLWPADHSGVNTPVNPHSGPSNWALAKAHFQMADGAYHEAISHLLDTHLIIELIAVCAQRHLHPDHPVSQLLSPHFRDNLAIDALARTSLLNRGGPIDSAIGVGARGALNLVGAVWANWDFQRMALHRDLADRGLDDRDTLPFCWYREDATALATATRQLTRSLVDVWYVDEAVAGRRLGGAGLGRRGRREHWRGAPRLPSAVQEPRRARRHAGRDPLSRLRAARRGQQRAVRSLRLAAVLADLAPGHPGQPGPGLRPPHRRARVLAHHARARPELRPAQHGARLERPDLHVDHPHRGRARVLSRPRAGGRRRGPDLPPAPRDGLEQPAPPQRRAGDGRRGWLHLPRPLQR
jgi:hypothetical protein